MKSAVRPIIFSELGILSSKDQGACDDAAVKHLSEAQGPCARG